MSYERETAYPHFKDQYTQEELAQCYTPDKAELALARQNTRQPTARLCFLALLKTAQYLGYFVQIHDIPLSLIQHLAHCLGYRQKRLPSNEMLDQYDRSGARQRHLRVLRSALGMRPFDQSGTELMNSVALRSAQGKEQVTDIINEILEELIHHSYELPAFSLIEQTATKTRKQIRRELFSRYHQSLTPNMLCQIDRLFVVDTDEPYSLWHEYRRECGKPTANVVKEYLTWLNSVKQQAESLPPLEDLPASRQKALFHEARSYNAWNMRRLEDDKRYTLTALLIRQRYATALDDVSDIFIRLARQIDHKAREDHVQHVLKHSDKADLLVSRFYQVLTAWQSHDELETTDVDELLNEDTDEWVEACRHHLNLAGDGHYPFLMTPYQKRRSQLFNCLELLELVSTTQDNRLLQALAWIKENRKKKRRWLADTDIPSDLVTLDWLPKPWHKLIIPTPEKGIAVRWHRSFLELAVFTLVMEDLNAGDLSVLSSDEYNDFRAKLISWDEYRQYLADYGEKAGLPTDPQPFIDHLKQELEEAARFADERFPDCSVARFEKNDRLVLSKPDRKPRPEGLSEVQSMVKARMPSLNILELLIETERWLNLHRMFEPASGEPGRLEDPRKRFVTTLFCYGCNLGPSQTARSVKGLSRKQIAWMNIGYISEESLDRAIVVIINAYNKFQLPKYWGSGEHVAADGTRWDVYEQNLLSQYHIRYGSYGGIGYYHISDQYIALFSHFITCGTYEGIYILNGLEKNESDIQPGTVHGDTHSQNEPIFGLAYLLGIELMPRIRRMSHQHFYRPDAAVRYQHIDSLFRQSIDWELIKRHLPDMLRVAISIQKGKIDASTVLRRLGSKTRKNRLYFAFRELGRAVRTRFLLRYIIDIELRKIINQATIKCEEFNDFCKWLMFGGEGVIAENLRHEQRKIIKYNHLVCNLVILHNVQTLSAVLKDMAKEGVEITPEIVAGFSPYAKGNINRFGDYRLDMERPIPAFDSELVIPIKE